MVLRKVAEIEAAGARSVKAACHTLIHSARAGLLPTMLVDNLRAARDKRGRSSPDGLPSTRALELWVLRAQRGESLVPKKPQPDMVLKLWHVAALDLKRRPQKPTSKMVHEQLTQCWDMAWGAEPPSYDQVIYFFKHKFSNTDLMIGQHMGSALSAKKAYQKRSPAGVPPFVEVHADGWNTHFRAPHPVTGEFVTLEVWHFHELVTGYVTRPSIGLSESTAVILCGLENYIREMGIPAVWQTDSTGSVKNKTVEKDPLVSLAARAGISIVHPVRVGNSQANGIAENWNTWIDREARELATYQHPRMDPLAFKQVRKFTDKMVKADRAGDLQGRDKNKKAAQHAGKGLVFDSFAQATDWINSKVLKFNNSPHSKLPRVTDPVTGKRRHQTPAEAVAEAKDAGFAPARMAEIDLIDLFRLHFKRRVQRTVVKAYMSQEYRHSDLEAVNGEDVMVAVDIMDGSRVWVKDLTGRLICEAELVQVTGYRAMSFYEYSLEKRASAQLKLLDQKAEQVAQRMQMPALDMATPDAHIVYQQALTNIAQTRQEEAELTQQAAEEVVDFEQKYFGAAAEAANKAREEGGEQDEDRDLFAEMLMQQQAKEEEEKRREAM